MDFNLTEERAMLQDMLQRFLAETYDHEARRQLLAEGKPFDADIMAKLAELGVLGALLPEEAGGFGGAGFDLSVVFEELGRAGTIEPILSNAVLAGGLVTAQGSEDQKAMLSEVIAGQAILAFAHSEPTARYDLNQISTKAVAEGDKIVLTGTKAHVLNGAEANMLVVSAREAGEDHDQDGISLFVVPADAEGVMITGRLNIDGTAAAMIQLEGVVLDTSARLGEPGKAYDAIETAVARAILAVCAEALGAMEAAKDLTINYLKERKQFGVAIGKFQALQHRMADLLIEVEQARSAVVNLAGNIDAPRDQRERYVSAAKNLIGRAGALVAEETIQMHGGIGMTDEYALSHFARRLVMIDHLFGDVDHHLERFIALNAA